MTDEEFEHEYDLLQARLKPRLDDAFLETLVQAARTRGHCGDYMETLEFVTWCFEVAGKPVPESDQLKPFLSA